MASHVWTHFSDNERLVDMLAGSIVDSINVRCSAYVMASYTPLSDLQHTIYKALEKKVVKISSYSDPI